MSWHFYWPNCDFWTPSAYWQDEAWTRTASAAEDRVGQVAPSQSGESLRTGPGVWPIKNSGVGCNLR